MFPNSSCMSGFLMWRLMLMMLPCLKEGSGSLMLMADAHNAGICSGGVSEARCRGADAHDAGWEACLKQGTEG